MKYRVYTSTRTSSVSEYKVNEDRYMFADWSFMGDEHIHALVVADGVGSLVNVSKSAAMAVREFLKDLFQEIIDIYMQTEMDGFSLQYSSAQVEQAMLHAAQAANQAVCSIDPLRPTGTTLSAVCIFGTCAVAINVGDSPIYFYRKETRAFEQIAELQTLAELDVKRGVLERDSEEYLKSERQNSIYQYLGKSNTLQTENISVKTIGSLKAGDRFLIGSDGAFGTMTEREIKNIADCGEDEEIYLLDCLFDKGNWRDDQTAIFYVVSDQEEDELCLRI